MQTRRASHFPRCGLLPDDGLLVWSARDINLDLCDDHARTTWGQKRRLVMFPSLTRRSPENVSTERLRCDTCSTAATPSRCRRTCRVRLSDGVLPLYAAGADPWLFCPCGTGHDFGGPFASSEGKDRRRVEARDEVGYFESCGACALIFDWNA